MTGQLAPTPPVSLSFTGPDGPVEIGALEVHFSAWRCFAGDEPDQPALLGLIAEYLVQHPGGLALYAGDMLDRLMAEAPWLAVKVHAVIDPTGKGVPGLPTITESAALPETVTSVFLCETRTHRRAAMARTLPPGLKALSPDIVQFLTTDIPRRAWLRRIPSIYPIDIPPIEVRPGLDLLLLDMPSRICAEPPLGMAYVHEALKKTSLRFQTIDADIILYHRFNSQRLLDTGLPTQLGNGKPMLDDPWYSSESAWEDPRLAPFLLQMFREDLDEIIGKVIAARPKILAMSVHMRNEWSTRAVARRVKAALPEIVILAGGHSCNCPGTGPKAFPEYDYMVIGEADLVVGPLAESLARGERPANLPGVRSRHDDPARPFTPGPAAQDLDALGAPAFDWFPDPGVYRMASGFGITPLNLTRGCVWARCTFCAERFAFRTRSPKSYVDDIERYLRAGRPPIFHFSESDFGGKSEVLYEVAREIKRRGLKISIGGQLRINARCDLDFFLTLSEAGLKHPNFGVDALTPNTLRLQRKGYSLETALRNLKDARLAGMEPQINLVVGCPGETDQDIEDTIANLIRNRHIIPVLFNANPFYMAANSIYWEEPEKHNIHFYGDRKAIYEKYPFGVPSHLWYSAGPFIDADIRHERLQRLLSGARDGGLELGPAALTVAKRLFGGVTSMREFSATGVLHQDDFHLPPYSAPLPTDSTEGCDLCRIGNNTLAMPQGAARRLPPGSMVAQYR
ncbi:MAG: radical SAM protein [Rhodospirillales bacterium]|nr:radical SAM protein [Rhodospirillales bacterium]